MTFRSREEERKKRNKLLQKISAEPTTRSTDGLTADVRAGTVNGHWKNQDELTYAYIQNVSNCASVCRSENKWHSRRAMKSAIKPDQFDFPSSI